MKPRFVLFLVGLVTVTALLLSGCAPEATPTDEAESAAPEEEGGKADAPATPSTETFKWRAQAIYPAGSVYYNHGERVAQDIKEMSGGRIDVSYFPAGGVVPALQEMEACDMGTLEAFFAPMSLWTGKVGLVANLWTGYPAGPGPVEMMVWIDEYGGMALWEEMVANAGLNLVNTGYGSVSSAESFAWTNKPILKLSDFEGLKFRSGGMWGNVLGTLGASVVTLPGGELYPSMERGVIDSFEYCCPGMDITMGFYEIADYWEGPGIHSPMSDCEFVVNGDVWNELPEDLKAIVKEAVQSNGSKNWHEMERLDAEAMDFIRDYGTEIVILPDDVQLEIIRVSNEFLDGQAADDAFFKKVLDSQRAFLESYRVFKSSAQPTIGTN